MRVVNSSAGRGSAPARAQHRGSCGPLHAQTRACGRRETRRGARAHRGKLKEVATSLVSAPPPTSTTTNPPCCMMKLERKKVGE